MPDAANPLIPAWYDIVWSVTAVVVVVLLVVALVSLARAARTLSAGQSLVWTLVAIFVPVLGPLAWLFIGKRSVESAPQGHVRSR